MSKLITAILLFSSSILLGQFGIGGSFSLDPYQRYVNPEDNISDPSSGNAILNLATGPKIWIGHKGFSVSAEAQVNIGLTSFTVGENKGLGTLAFPLIGSLNFGGLSTMEREGKPGFTVGGGLQYNKTELYGLDQEFIDKGVVRDYFPTYIIQAGGGFGVSGFAMKGIVRYGFDPDSNASSLNVGIQLDFNLPMMRKIDDPNSAL